MSTTEDRTEQIVELVEQYTDIGISEDSSSWGTFERVLADIGAAALDHETEHGGESRELVNAFEVIGAAFERVTAERVHAGLSVHDERGHPQQQLTDNAEQARREVAEHLRRELPDWPRINAPAS